MRKSKKCLAIVIAVTMLFTMLFSGAYIAAEANHHCSGEDCPICEEVALCQNTWKQFSATVAETAAVFVFLFALLLSAIQISKKWESITLITLKVKLSD